jgi:hypothetical protein
LAAVEDGEGQCQAERPEKEAEGESGATGGAALLGDRHRAEAAEEPENEDDGEHERVLLSFNVETAPECNISRRRGGQIPRSGYAVGTAGDDASDD